MKILNTLTNKKEEFVPINEGEVKIYCCGPTVYNYFHIGNARPFVVFDVLRRYLIYKGYKVTFVQNFTDVDDKIIRRSKEEGITPTEVADKYIKEYYTDAKGLNIMKADVHPRVSENIPEIIQTVQTLIDKGYAYESNGDVYFDVSAFPTYGKLSGQSMDDLISGAREVVFDATEHKKSPVDFAVWKAKKDGEIAWESPWGEGRPGWHIECSVMSRKYLGESIDIHGGGQDLIFPHHENEIAQSEASTGKKFVNYWMHNGYINVDNVKMSKSLGNFFTVRDISEKFDLEVVRFFILSAQYRSPINFSDEGLRQAQAGLERLYNAKNNLTYLISNAKTDEMSDEEAKWVESLGEFQTRFDSEMDDDLNTANAVSVLFELAKEINKTVNDETSKACLEATLALLTKLGDVLGILYKGQDSIDEEIEKLIEERTNAKKEKNYARADEIRNELLEKGIVLKDTKDGVKWEKISK